MHYWFCWVPLLFSYSLFNSSSICFPILYSTDLFSNFYFLPFASFGLVLLFLFLRTAFYFNVHTKVPLSSPFGVMYFYLLNRATLPIKDCSFCCMYTPSHAFSLSHTGETSCHSVSWALEVKQGLREVSAHNEWEMTFANTTWMNLKVDWLPVELKDDYRPGPHLGRTQSQRNLLTRGWIPDPQKL